MKTKLFYTLIVLFALGTTITSHAQDVYRESKGLDIKHFSKSELWFIQKIEVDSSYTCDGISKQCKVARYNDPKLEKVTVVGFDPDTVSEKTLGHAYNFPGSKAILDHKLNNGCESNHYTPEYKDCETRTGIIFPGLQEPMVYYQYNNFAIVYDKNRQIMSRVLLPHSDGYPSFRTYVGYGFFVLCWLYFLFNSSWKRKSDNSIHTKWTRYVLINPNVTMSVFIIGFGYLTFIPLVIVFLNGYISFLAPATIVESLAALVPLGLSIFFLIGSDRSAKIGPSRGKGMLRYFNAGLLFLIILVALDVHSMNQNNLQILYLVIPIPVCRAINSLWHFLNDTYSFVEKTKKIFRTGFSFR